jgi:2-polyprenyl-6-methoxyphenol hydroxylase-like FAD-dependent oxidoreductase
MSGEYDVVVVGARVAGASTALLLARAGARVALVDRAPYGTDTLSTHAFMRAGALQLRRWGLLDEVVAAGAPAVRRTTFHYSDGESAERAIPSRLRFDPAPGWMPCMRRGATSSIASWSMLPSPPASTCGMRRR